MALPSVTYTFSNGTTADADEVNQNFTDIINGITDGTKDLSISALTCAGAVNLNGNVTIGNASSDDLTVNASLASTLAVKTTNTYDLGGSTLGFAGLYLGANSQTVRIVGSGSMSATYTLTLPVNGGTQGYGLETNGSGTLSYKPMQTDTSAKNADYTVLDNDGISVIKMTTGASDRTVTLPTATDNSGRVIKVVKVDSDVGKCTIDGEGAETINGKANIVLYAQYDYVVLVCDGTEWFRTSGEWNWVSYTPNISGFGTETSVNFEWRRLGGNTIKIRGSFNSGTPAASEAQIPTPESLTIAPSGGGSLAEIVGQCERGATSPAGENQRITVLGTDGDAFFNLGYKLSGASINALAPANGNNLVATNDRLSLWGEVSVDELA